MSKWILGLTGGVSSGKTTVCNFFKEFGCAVVDADLCARKVVMPGTKGLKKLTEHFGKSILNPDGTLDRKALRNIIFSDDDKLSFVNKTLHPLIHEQIMSELDEATGCYVVLAAPLLFENHLEHIPSRILCMDADPETQIMRTVERDGCSYEIAKAMVAHQLPREIKIKSSDDVVISNYPTLDELKQKIHELHTHYLTLIKQDNAHD
ncbi:dephospho-CoA kinase [uncultured Ruminobacter sp.]|uniref:dephospho-CoA kinase n=1 Tax=uncultured Ruminobacter sp. TaxID=538947 RepID=UPI0025FFAD00|nr:dephospho-CoA kinase [uncultured Ruminobacter sp.]